METERELPTKDGHILRLEGKLRYWYFYQLTGLGSSHGRFPHRFIALTHLRSPHVPGAPDIGKMGMLRRTRGK